MDYNLNIFLIIIIVFMISIKSNQLLDLIEENNTKEFKENKTNPSKKVDVFNLASLYSEFHRSILDFFNKVISNNLNSEEVKKTYINVVIANNKLLNINKGIDNEFFKGRISRKSIEKFFDYMIFKYKKWIKSDAPQISKEEKSILETMIDNYNEIIQKNYFIQESGKFKKYEILFSEKSMNSTIGNLPFIKVDAINFIESKEDL